MMQKVRGGVFKQRLMENNVRITRGITNDLSPQKIASKHIKSKNYNNSSSDSIVRVFYSFKTKRTVSRVSKQIHNG